MKVTNYMIFKWSKSILLIIFGIIFLIYMEAVLAEVRSIFSSIPGMPDLTGLFDLSFAIYFIIAIWCFVDAALNILTSFREQRTSLDDIAAKLDEIEMKLAGAKPQQPAVQPSAMKPMVVQQESVSTSPAPMEAPTPAPPTDVPPPP